MKNSHLTFTGLLLAWSAALALPATAPAPAAGPTKETKLAREADDFFAGEIPRLKIELSAEQRERLAKDERHYAEATMTESTAAGPVLYQKVSVKLKGSAGSFQHMDAKPGLTINLEKIKGGERFHGMKKFHLNNCAQDGTYLNELMAGAMARKAGVPASRCSHAFVEFNGRDLGLFVVKEAFTQDFLAPFFKSTEGDLYDGGFCAEIHENMVKDKGDPNDKTALKELIATCQEGDNAKRWERLGKILDIDKFISFCAMEDILCHWDGYNFNRNNYRLYRDADTGKFSFFLHGMDQMFGDENFPIIRDFGALVGGAVMRCPAALPLYKARVESIYENVLLKEDWAARISAEGRRVRDAIATKDGKWAKDYEGQINEVRGRVARRIAAVGKQLGAIPRAVAFDANGVFKIAKGWSQEGTGALCDEAAKDGQICLHIRTDGATAASWRQTLHLDAGRYRFEGKLAIANVVGVKDASGEGAGLRISGGVRDGQNAAVGSAAWQPLGYTFETPGGDIVLVAELRASKGEVWFARDSLRLVKVK